MSHFYGTLQGTRGEATRCGDAKKGYRAIAAGWQGAIRTYLKHEPVSGKDFFYVYLAPWGNTSGDDILLAQGPLDIRTVRDGGLVVLNPELVRRYTEAEAFKIMKEGT